MWPNGVKNARPVHVSETWEQIVILGSSWNFFFSDKEIQIFRCSNSDIQMKLLLCDFIVLYWFILEFYMFLKIN
jgi:hypothetical protein